MPAKEVEGRDPQPDRERSALRQRTGGSTRSRGLGPAPSSGTRPREFSSNRPTSGPTEGRRSAPDCREPTIAFLDRRRSVTRSAPSGAGAGNNRPTSRHRLGRSLATIFPRQAPARRPRTSAVPSSEETVEAAGPPTKTPPSSAHLVLQDKNSSWRRTTSQTRYRRIPGPAARRRPFGGGQALHRTRCARQRCRSTPWRRTRSEPVNRRRTATNGGDPQAVRGVAAQFLPVPEGPQPVQFGPDADVPERDRSSSAPRQGAGRPGEKAHGEHLILVAPETAGGDAQLAASTPGSSRLRPRWRPTRSPENRPGTTPLKACSCKWPRFGPRLPVPRSSTTPAPLF